MVVEYSIEFLVEWRKGERLFLLLGSIPEILTDVADKADDIALFHTQTQIVCSDLTELHQLVDKLCQSSDTTFGCLYRFSLGTAILP